MFLTFLSLKSKVQFTNSTHFRRIPDGNNQLSSSSASSPKSSNSLAAQFRHPKNIHVHNSTLQCPIPKRLGQLKGSIPSGNNNGAQLQQNFSKPPLPNILSNGFPSGIPQPAKISSNLGSSLFFVNGSLPLYRPPPNKKLNLRKNINKSFDFKPKNYGTTSKSKFSLFQDSLTDHRKVAKLQRQLRQKQEKFQKTGGRSGKSSGKGRK